MGPATLRCSVSYVVFFGQTALATRGNRDRLTILENRLHFGKQFRHTLAPILTVATNNMVHDS